MSNQLIRMSYASKATFKPFNAVDGVDANVANILSTARRENRKNNLVGALYYGNGCFFQCLEGQKSDIDALYAKLEKDPRHTDLKVLSIEPIQQVGFVSWEMKYAQIDQEVRAFLKNHQLGKFDPYRFSPEMTAELVAVLQKADEGLSDAELKHIDSVSNSKRASGVSMGIYIMSIVIAVVVTALVTLWMTAM